MIVYVFLVLALLLFRLQFAGRGFHADFIGRDSIQPIKGVFILLIIVSHFIQYVKLDGPLDAYYMTMRTFLRQMVVVPFLFYSGYGVTLSIIGKGDAYLRGIPVRWVLKVLFQFDVAVLLFVLVRWMMGDVFPFGKVMLSLVGWSSVGNSNWYIFAILILYLISYLTFSSVRGIKSALVRQSVAVWIQAGLIVALIVVLKQCRPSCVYNTLLSYAAGSMFAVYGKAVIDWTVRSNLRYLGMLFLAFAAFLALHHFWNRSLVCYELAGVAFAGIIVLLSLKFVSRCPVLAYCGTHLFSLYVLQRLPMWMLKNDWFVQHRYLYLAAVVTLTFPLSYVFDKVVPYLWDKILVSCRVESSGRDSVRRS